MPFDKELFWARTYQNPVYPRSFPDPYVLKFGGEYFAYCTDFWTDGRVFGVLRSRDLVNWTECGGAMTRLDSGAPFYWAPEVVYFEGLFYLYYSVGNETLMELRVAVSDRPDGDFVDSGKRLSTEDFAIDAHVFADSDGRRWLFYATDFLDYEYVGTGTVIDELLDPFTLAGSPRPVTRARFDWQVYDPARKEKGGVRWHTVEGPFVLKRKGVYYEMFSGGNWQNVTYGVSFAVTESLARTDEWDQFSDGDQVLPILRTIPGRIVGPGHNSVVRGPNNRETFCVYHRWTEAGRVLAVDRMDFAGRRIFIKGATDTRQPAPFAPTFADDFADALPAAPWRVRSGEWKAGNGEFACGGAGRVELDAGGPRFLGEFWLRAAGREKGGGIALVDADGHDVRRFPFAELFAGDDGSRPRHVRVEADGEFAAITVDEWREVYRGPLGAAANGVAFDAETAVVISSASVTRGFEDLFTDGLRDWSMRGGHGEFEVKEDQLFLRGEADGGHAMLVRGEALGSFECIVNLRLVEEASEEAAFGFALLGADGVELYRFTFAESGGGLFHLAADADLRTFALPAGFEPRESHQFRFLKTRSRFVIEMERHELGSVTADEKPSRVAVFVRGAEIALEMVRVTEI